MKSVKKVFLYWNTVRYLRPVQIVHQAEKRLFRGRRKRLEGHEIRPKVPPVRKISIVIPELDCDRTYLERFSPDLLLENRIKLLHEVHEIGDRWQAPKASHLWNFNLHYLEFLIPLAVLYRQTGDRKYFEKWKQYLKSWMGQASGDSMEPYTVSLRIPNILIGLELLKDETEGTELEKEIRISLYGQYRYLAKNTELSLLANHYFENLKAIVICSVLFGEQEMFRKFFSLLEKQISEQILPDGVHFELSPMYHRIILEDLLRIYRVLESAGYEEQAARLVHTINAMTAAMENIESGFDTIPLFNDAGNNVPKRKEALMAAAKRICKYEAVQRTEFPDSGYYRLDTGNCAVLFDCGKLGPSYMGGHSHCDCLSFELSVSGHKIFSNSGTGQYQGELRGFFRSTAAHNTLMIDDREQSELWGEHRAARRISRVAAKKSGHGVTGQFQSYRGDRFQREMSWENGGLSIVDSAGVRDDHVHIARQFFHLTPEYRYESRQEQICVKDSQNKTAAIIRLPKDSTWKIHTGGLLTTYAPDFGQYLHKEVLEVRTEFRDSTRIKIRIEIRDNN